ncbi:putative membrane protein YfcA [Alkalispirillum mobile]|uniref:Probable membrane transporter protein n=1 Tax=Alkalispirillum mobile TaxID=85925 RepID=A0A498CCB3_9GAMM|nr:sulfite exporter TauE/SafE family protein [Alkalispirillum mobile]RLK50880.1 putative membrane protein YfcA [Alkalispirillum mobile]
MNGLELVLLVVGLLGTGVLAGIMAGLLGVGGGIVIVPVLFYVFTLLEVDPAVQMHLAVGTSLAVVVPTSLRSAINHHRNGTVDVPLLRTLWPALLIGVLLGVALSAWVSGAVLTGVFGFVALLVALNMARAAPPPHLAERTPGIWGQRAIGGFVGTVSTMMGIGGGTLSVPIFQALRFPMHRSVGTAAAIGCIISIPGVIGFLWAGLGVPDRPPFSIGYVSLLGFLLIAPATVFFAPYGVKLAMRLNTVQLRRAFALFLFITAVLMLHRTFFG